MGLFGPLDYAISGRLLRGVSSDVYGLSPDMADYSIDSMRFGLQRPRLVPNPYLLTLDDQAADAAPPVANPIAPLPRLVVPPPSMQMLGTFTTRRTQLFGPLSGISI